jgi:hypothetical protein
MEDGWSRWTDAEMKVKFDPVYGTKLIQGWQKKLSEVRNVSFGSGRFSPSARKEIFARKAKDKRPPAARKTKRQIK